jgi:hypothetical protein
VCSPPPCTVAHCTTEHGKGVIDTATRAAQFHQMVAAMPPVRVGTLDMLAHQAMNIIAPEMNRPGGGLWDRALHLMELLL